VTTRSLFLLPRAWRGYFTRQETRFRGRLVTLGELGLIWWPFGEATRRGAVRGFAAVTLACCGAVACYWATSVSADSAGLLSHVSGLVGKVFAS
jgi:hypothetical protein